MVCIKGVKTLSRMFNVFSHVSPEEKIIQEVPYFQGPLQDRMLSALLLWRSSGIRRGVKFKFKMHMFLQTLTIERRANAGSLET